MLRFSSLKTRILVLTTIPLCALLVGTLAVTLRTADQAVRTSMRRSLSDAGQVFVKLLETRQSELLGMAGVTARDPRFFATFSIPEEERGEEFGPTLEGVSIVFLRITGADFIEIFDGRGRFIAYIDKTLSTHPNGMMLGAGSIREALGGTPTADFYRAGDGNDESFNANMIVAAFDIAPDIDGVVLAAAYNLRMLQRVAYGGTRNPDGQGFAAFGSGQEIAIFLRAMSRRPRRLPMRGCAD